MPTFDRLTRIIQMLARYRARRPALFYSGKTIGDIVSGTLFTLWLQPLAFRWFNRNVEGPQQASN